MQVPVLRRTGMVRLVDPSATIVTVLGRLQACIDCHGPDLALTGAGFAGV